MGEAQRGSALLPTHRGQAQRGWTWNAGEMGEAQRGSPLLPFGRLQNQSSKLYNLKAEHKSGFHLCISLSEIYISSPDLPK